MVNRKNELKLSQDPPMTVLPVFSQQKTNVSGADGKAFECAAWLVAEPVIDARQWQTGLRDLEDQSTFEPS